MINAATMAPERMEVELFGCEAGFLGADRPRQLGTFERAHGGTLLLDEVADMPLETQGKILRVLQEQSFLRLGGQRRIEVDVRVIAASNRDLQGEIAAGRFREDLYYRLNVVPIRVPPLSERRADIPMLAEYFMARAAETAGLPPRRLSPEALALLQSSDWPGNVRQLRNVLEWLLIMAPGDAKSRDQRRQPAAGARRDRDRRASAPPATASSWCCRSARRASISSAPTCRPSSSASAATSRAPRASSAWSARRCTAS